MGYRTLGEGAFELRTVYNEHFVLEAPGLRIKQGHELRADSLQAPDDPQATYRKKAGCDYKGYVLNATATCDPSNPFQLVVDVQANSNTTDDSVLLTTALPADRRQRNLHRWRLQQP